jgi:hypothetical protein
VADRLARIAPDVVVSPFELVELFDDGEGDNDLVLLEDEEGVGIVEKDVGVENEVLDLGGALVGVVR